MDKYYLEPYTLLMNLSFQKCNWMEVCKYPRPKVLRKQWLAVTQSTTTRYPGHDGLTDLLCQSD